MFCTCFRSGVDITCNYTTKLLSKKYSQQKKIIKDYSSMLHMDATHWAPPDHITDVRVQTYLYMYMYIYMYMHIPRHVHVHIWQTHSHLPYQLSLRNNLINRFRFVFCQSLSWDTKQTRWPYSVMNSVIKKFEMKHVHVYAGWSCRYESCLLNK